MRMCDCSAAVLDPSISFHFNLLKSFFLILGNEQTLMKIPKEKVNEISHGRYQASHFFNEYIWVDLMAME